MVLKLARRIAALVTAALVAALIGFSGPAAAHRDHNKVEEVAEEPGNHQMEMPRIATPGAMREAMDEHAEAMEPRPTTFGGRLMRWLGQMHPFAVHFPIALFPVSWVALIIARRRGDAVDLIRAFIIVAGAAAVAAATLGWLSAGFGLADEDPMLTAHRWIGTGLAIVGVVLAAWAWRRASSVNSRLMVWLLGAATLALLVQGWLGAVLVHGMEHMAF